MRCLLELGGGVKDSHISHIKIMATIGNYYTNNSTEIKVKFVFDTK